MPRFIDEEKIDFRLPYYPDEDSGDTLVSLKTVKRCIAMTPTEDVVPKSEVDRLIDKWIGEETLTQDEKTLRLIEALRDEAKRYERYYFNHEYDKLIAKAKAEVAREIFEEIYEDCFDQFGYIDYEALAELKKKYTEQTEKDYFTPEDVQRMTAKDVRDNYTAIMESMKKWK